MQTINDMTRIELLDEIDRLKGWLETLANLRRVVGFTNDDLVEAIAQRALNGEKVPGSLKYYAAPAHRDASQPELPLPRRDDTA